MKCLEAAEVYRSTCSLTVEPKCREKMWHVQGIAHSQLPVYGWKVKANSVHHITIPTSRRKEVAGLPEDLQEVRKIKTTSERLA